MKKGKTTRKQQQSKNDRKRQAYAEAQRTGKKRWSRYAVKQDVPLELRHKSNAPQGAHGFPPPEYQTWNGQKWVTVSA